MEERELLLERLELALDRIREIPGEDWQEESLQHWKEYFTAVAKFLLLIEDTRQFLEQGKQNTATLEDLKPICVISMPMENTWGKMNCQWRNS